MPIVFMKFMRRRDLRENRSQLFVFGDNLLRRGLGGQARECRGEPNAVGIPTKRRPSNSPDAFLTDADLAVWRTACGPDFERIESWLNASKIVVFPEAGLGTGRAQLEQSAPIIWAELQEWLDKLKRNYYVYTP
jgi:hypothetical protein